MKLFKSEMLKGAALAALLIAGAASHAKADYAFSGSGASGFLNVPASAEPWHNGYADGNPNGWGSPGVSYGTTAYSRTQAAYGMEITFAGGGSPILGGSVAIGNGAACAGSSGGGTTFCTLGPTDIWEAFQVGPDSIDFLAQNATFNITNGQQYFVNILFDGAAPSSFTGKWLTNFHPEVPEPASLLVLGGGLVALGAVRRAKRK
jgi:hypothetical protein